jgi:uncharacterized protein YbbK (DUF523 family)/uncharacterized protein YbgA (DUF1722 family)
VDRLRVGISRCLLGDEVRYDAGHKRDAFLVETLGREVEWVPVCPEVEMGMGTPREPIQLVASNRGVASAQHRVRLVGVTSGRDWTDEMVRWRRARLRDLVDTGLSGYVLKAGSPSCGLARVPVHNARRARRDGRGLFAQALVDAIPNLPVEDERTLQEAPQRENFVERIFAYDRLRRFFAGRWTCRGLTGFHEAHELQLRLHSRDAHQALNRLVAGAKELDRRDVASVYQRVFMEAMQTPATRSRHTAVMRHVSDRLKRVLEEGSRRELLSAIDEYRSGLAPLVTPMALIRDHVRAHAVDDLARQVYLYPHPRELWLRNHV